ncbi:MAG: biotin-independent malonate decarboxylase subunit gamma [Pseudomonadota bacterium]|nr:biotin-independent malonate decarboxylase subunit gamma [Pseudomonadota bacterium]
MSDIQTLFSRTHLSTPLAELVREDFKKVKAIIKAPANRNLVIGITAGKVVAGAFIAHGLASGNSDETSAACLTETVVSYWLIPPIIAIRSAIQNRVRRAAKAITAPITKLPAVASAIVNAPVKKTAAAVDSSTLRTAFPAVRTNATTSPNPRLT